MSVYVKGGAADLRAEFTVEGVPTDPTTVSLTVIDPAGTTTTPIIQHPDTGLYTYLLALDQEGLWRWEFVGTGTATGVRSGALRVLPGIADAPASTVFVTIEDIETAAGRELTGEESERADQLVASLLDVLEIRLNRWLWPRSTTETHLIGRAGRLRLWRGPVRSITSLTLDGVAVTTAATLAAPEDAVWYEGATVVVTYVAGDDLRPAVAGLLTDVVARTIRAGSVAASGAMSSYSVEGTSITYGPVASGGQGGSGRLAVGDIRAIGRLRRPVLL